MTAEEITDALRRRHPMGKDRNGLVLPWVFVPEMRFSTGYRNESRIDAVAVHTWPSTGYERWAFEIKVHRADWIRELRKPWKRAPWMQVCHRFVFVVAGTVKVHPSEVPEGCGLWTWTGKQLRTLVEPPAGTPVDPPVWWWASLTRRLAELSADRERITRELAELHDFLNETDSVEVVEPMDAASDPGILSSVVELEE